MTAAIPSVDPEILALRQFVPQDADLSDWSILEPMYQSLLDRELGSLADLEQWLADYSELSKASSEYGSRVNIAFSCHTDDKEIEKAYLHLMEEISPKAQPFYFELKKKYLACSFISALPDEPFALLTREWKSDVELFREENIPIGVELGKLAKQYDQIIGEMQVEYEGESYTLQQIARYQEDVNREVREATWKLSAERRHEDREAIDDIFGQMLLKRQETAKNADHETYRDYMWEAKARFDYTPQQCLDFGDAIEATVVPVIAKLDQQRREALGVDVLRPWDGSVDPLNRPPLMPYDKDDVADMVARTKTIFGQIEPGLADDFGKMQFGRNLDLDSRKGKRAGGYQASLSESGEPFIFMNAAGLQRDVETMLHEGGHAFHYVWGRTAHPLMFFHHAPIEFCEVASMSMELFAMDHMGVFYADEADVARAKRKQLEGVLRVLPWVATIDGFQQALYGDASVTPDQVGDHWQTISNRFKSGVTDWTSYEHLQAKLWHRQLHLFHVPFYYIEYGIAQLGALQLWAQYEQDPKQALANYRKGLSLAGTKPLPDLFEACGLDFKFDQETLAPLVERIANALDALPQ